MDNILIDLGFIKIYWYSFMICVGAVIGAILAVREGKRQNIPKELIINYFFYLMIFGIIGARIYFVIFKFSNYQDNLLNIFRVWEGGLAIHGGVIAGLLFTWYYTKKHKINFFKMTDIVVVSLILGQAIGRWGNFFNQEAFGPETSPEQLKNMHIPGFVIDNMLIKEDGLYHQPTFFYESVWCLAGFLYMLVIRTYKKLKVSNLTSFYMIWYGIGRFYIESLRTDSLEILNLKTAQLVSLLSIAFGIVLLIITILSKKHSIYYHKKEKINV